MNDQQIYTLATISNMYTTLHEQAKATRLSLISLRLTVFADMLTEDQKTVLIRAGDIVEEISRKTHVRDGVKYFNSIKDEVVTPGVEPLDV